MYSGNIFLKKYDYFFIIKYPEFKFAIRLNHIGILCKKKYALFFSLSYKNVCKCIIYKVE